MIDPSQHLDKTTKPQFWKYDKIIMITSRSEPMVVVDKTQVSGAKNQFIKFGIYEMNTKVPYQVKLYI